MKFQKIKLLSLALVCCVFLNSTMLSIQAEAPTITIDGNFNDWSSASEQQQAIANSNFSGYAAFQDEEVTYIHIVGNSNWVNLAGDTISYINEAQEEKKINFNGLNGDPFVLSIKNEDYKVMEGASMSGSLQNSNREWEIKLPKSLTGNIAKLVFQGTEISSIPTLSQEMPPIDPEEPDIPEEPELPPTKEGITIDGYFDDWTNLHHIDINWDNAVVTDACAVLGDEDTVCVHVGTAYREDRHLNLDNIRIIINDGSATQIKLRQYNKDGSISTEPLSDIKQNKRYEMAAVMEKDGQKFNLGKAYYSTKMAKEHEDFEFCINLIELEKALGLPEGSINSSSKIEFRFPSIGEGNIIIEGTSTGPLLGTGLCIGVVVIGYIVNKRRKEKPLK